MDCKDLLGRDPIMVASLLWSAPVYAPLRIAGATRRLDGCIAPEMRKPNHAALTAAVALLLCWGARLLVRHETSHDFGAAHLVGHYRNRTFSAAPHQRAARPFWFESGRRGGVSDLGGGLGVHGGSERRVGVEVALGQDAEWRQGSGAARGAPGTRSRPALALRRPPVAESGRLPQPESSRIRMISA
jgi:hypothetical protein